MTKKARSVQNCLRGRSCAILGRFSIFWTVTSMPLMETGSPCVDASHCVGDHVFSFHSRGSPCSYCWSAGLKISTPGLDEDAVLRYRESPKDRDCERPSEPDSKMWCLYMPLTRVSHPSSGLMEGASFTTQRIQCTLLLAVLQRCQFHMPSWHACYLPPSLANLSVEGYHACLLCEASRTLANATRLDSHLRAFACFCLAVVR